MSVTDQTTTNVDRGIPVDKMTELAPDEAQAIDETKDEASTDGS